MKQRWSVLKEACGIAYRYYQAVQQTDYSTAAQWIYKNIYRAHRATAPSAENQKNQQYWHEYTINAVGRGRSHGQDVYAQIQNAAGNQWVGHTDIRITPTQQDELVSVVHALSDATALARFQVTVKPAYCGQPLHTALLALPLARTPVAEFKVMNPQTGAAGPDSAVFYLSEPLSASGVAGLVAAIGIALRGKLEPLVPAPWGLQELGPGIYGIDIPSEADQRNVLGLTTDFGSAGNILSHLVAVAAAHAWRRAPLLDGESNDMYGVVRTCLGALCGQLSWELVE